ncbi:polyamine aminopropyltransferase [Acanthopleuribacter pedis]|uniref:Polyamine aminopropyltransferase n=1 Tax=Acanthopleuribacter pedis TaxID=442870 RepID=A0A8J7Q188_9BACT|nr:polyamine aminopropyltransferase [Acanthopleuribacter pedis]MBO1317255.1 polyamine aminopropyltransferase [Acanthopleuribacter pedis]MBO1318562.1 polyamine aminopropyltransferase [Acanthopleuribacter pedis]
MSETQQQSDNQLEDLSRGQIGVLLISIAVVALSGIAYELIIGTVSSYLLGNSVFQFSLTIGLFMFAMGIGSYLSKWLMKHLITNFVLVEITISLIGGAASLILFLAFPLVMPLYQAIMYTLIIVIGSLVGLEIPLLTRIISHKDSLKDSIAHVLSLDYVGALIGSMAFPLILLPFLGLIRSSFAIGLLNIGVAMINVVVFWKFLRMPRAVATFAGGTALLLVVALIGGTRLSTYAEQFLYSDEIIFSKQTQYQRIILTKSVLDHDHRLYLDGHIQFSQRDEYRYHEALVHPLMALPGPRKKVLIMGGGDGMAARELLKYDDVEEIHLVDIDPEMTRLCATVPTIAALNEGALEDPRVKIFHQDAFTFVNQAGVLYDRIISDLPDPHNEALNKLYAREFYTMLRKRMTPEGYLVSQSSSPFFTRKTYWCIATTMEAAGLHTKSFQITVPSFSIWGFHLAANQPVPPIREMDVPTRYMEADVFAAATKFPRDMARVETAVNSIMEPKLYHYYMKELREPHGLKATAELAKK